jgi:hypothetical protein
MTLFDFLSGVEMDERTIIGQAIEENAGKYVMDMQKGACTHLISDKTSGNKYKFALKWGGVYVVTTRWLRKSLDRVSFEILKFDYKLSRK